MFSSYFKSTGLCWQCTFLLWIHLIIKVTHSLPASRGGRNEPTDHYGRPLKEFGFMFSTCPSEREPRILNAIIRTCVERLVLMSPFDPKLAKEEWPFHLSLNVLLVLTGHCHAFIRFCYDNRALALQRIAREQHIGPLNCDFPITHVIGIDVDTTDDVVFSEFHCQYLPVVTRRISWMDTARRSSDWSVTLAWQGTRTESLWFQ